MDAAILPMILAGLAAMILVACIAYTAAILRRRRAGIVAANWERDDYRVLLLAAVASAIPTVVVLVLVFEIPRQHFLLAAGALVVGCLFIVEGLWHLRAYRRPGSMLFTPLLVRYWPSWIRVERNMAVGKLSTIRFKLTEAVFDLKTIRVPRADGTSSQQFMSPDVADAIAFARDHTILLPLRDNDEHALTETGRLRRDGPRPVQLLCVADAFLPARIERATTIEELLARGELLELTPTVVGRHTIRISLLAPELKVAAGVSVSARVS